MPLDRGSGRLLLLGAACIFVVRLAPCSGISEIPHKVASALYRTETRVPRLL